MIGKEIDGSTTKTSIKTVRPHRGVFEWTYNEGLITNDGTTIIYLIFKSINPATSIGVSNLKY